MKSNMKEFDGKHYYQKADGSLVPEDLVKPQDKLRDQTVYAIAEKLNNLLETMKTVKESCVADLAEYMKILAEDYGYKLDTLPSGSVSLTSYDGETKIAYANNEMISYNEGILVAKKLIDEYLEEAIKDSSEAVKSIVNAAFRMSQGKFDVKAIQKLRQVKIDDPRWIKAMAIIDDSRVVTPTNRSLRLYRKNKETSEMEMVNLNFSIV